MTIINPLPYTLSNGTTADATQVMADFNQIVANVNGNAVVSGGNVLQATSAGYATIDAAGVMSGFGATFSITPDVSTRLEVTIDGLLTTPFGAVNAEVRMRYGTGAAPAAGAALAGTAIGPAQQVGTNSAGPSAFAFSLTRIITGLTVGTAYWFDLGFLTSLAGNTVTSSSINVTAKQI